VIQILEEICMLLDNTGMQIIMTCPHEGQLSHVMGWQYPSLNKQELAELANSIARDTRKYNVDQLDYEQENIAVSIREALNFFQTNVFPNFFNGQGHLAIPLYIQTMETISNRLEKILKTPKLDVLPSGPEVSALLKRYSSLRESLDAYEHEVESIGKKIAAIDNAHETAQALPQNMLMLQQAKDSLSKLAEESKTFHAQMKSQSEAANSLIDSISTYQKEAAKLVEQCGTSQRIATSIGLSQAFYERARDLNKSMMFWVFGLAIALICGAVIGGIRIEILTHVLNSPNLDWGVIGLNLVLSVISVGAPLWFAWLSTKQISQRFRLAEDYGYKASVAIAYEGYKREAVSLDHDFEKRLFDIALTRLNDEPLRHMETTTHGSPFHEFASSKNFRKAIDAINQLAETAASTITSNKSDKKKPDNDADE